MAPTVGADPSHAGSREAGAPRRPGAAFALLGAVQLALILAITVIVVPLPAVQRDLGLSGAELALVSTAYGLSFSGLLLLGGRLADLFGRRRVFVFGVAVFGLASAAAGLAPRLEVLLAARFTQGVGAALAAPAAMSLLGVVFPDPVRRVRAVAIWGGLSSAGATAGTLLSGVVMTWSSWRLAFLVPVLVATWLDPGSRWYPRARNAYAGWGITFYLLGCALATQVAQITETLRH